ncbi:MAG: citramalate synthase, partial [Candidatus Omnitrophica bacterium]|nr:citramalate synthase [Candidatus Omnitrophota bacterium]
MIKIELYDTTLRDGSQGEGISYTVQDKLRIARKLDEIGIHIIEGGWPGSNPKDMAFFEAVKKEKLKNSLIAAFGSTRRAKTKPDEDPNLQALIASETPVVTIFGKTWDFHVKEALKTTLQENLNMIQDSVEFLHKKKRRIIYDAEHFFDGYKANPEYAIQTILAAEKAGAETIVLCDTN